MWKHLQIQSLDFGFPHSKLTDLVKFLSYFQTRTKRIEITALGPGRRGLEGEFCNLETRRAYPDFLKIKMATKS